MKKPFLLMDFKRMSDPNLLNKANTIFNSLTGNSFFNNPLPGLPTLSGSIVQFSNALLLAKDGDRIKIQEKNVLRNALVAVLVQLMDYVTYQAQGVRAVLMSSGFTVSSDTKTARLLGKLKNFAVVQGENSGDLAASVDPVKDANTYTFSFGPTPIVNDSWKAIAGKARKCVITGLDRGKEYSVRVTVVGPGKTIYSQVINIIVT